MSPADRRLLRAALKELKHFVRWDYSGATVRLILRIEKRLAVTKSEAAHK